MNPKLKEFLRPAYPTILPTYTFFHRHVVTPWNIRRNRKKNFRMLEVGPGPKRLDGFETLNVIAGLEIDYVLDASKPLPFEPELFDLIYASHVLEHIPWYQTSEVLKEWYRLLKKGGSIEIFVPDGLKISKTFILSEEENPKLIDQDGWYRFNDQHDPCIWANGRIFSYGDGSGRKNDPNWHFCLFSERYLRSLLENAGFNTIQKLSNADVRGHDHGWINLGMRGIKK